MNLLASASTYTQFADLLNLDLDMDMDNEKLCDDPLPVDAAAALAAAFGIGFNDMSRDGSSLDLYPDSTQPATENALQDDVENGGFEQGGSGEKAREYGNTTPPLDAAAALAASFGIGFDFDGSSGSGQGVSTAMVTSQPEEVISTEQPRLSYNSSWESPERLIPNRTEDVTAAPPVDAAAALAASFGIGFDDATDWGRRMGNGKSDGRRASTTVGTEVRMEPAKANEGKPRKRFKKRTGTTRERIGCLTCRQRSVIAFRSSIPCSKAELSSTVARHSPCSSLPCYVSYPIHILYFPIPSNHTPA